MPTSPDRPTCTTLWGHDAILADDGPLLPEVVAEVRAAVELV